MLIDLMSCLSASRSKFAFLVFICLFSLNVAFECNDEIGIFADPEDCRSYYFCDFVGFEHIQCDPGLLFDAEFLVCNYEEAVDCGDRPIPGISTTTSATTSTTGNFD